MQETALLPSDTPTSDLEKAKYSAQVWSIIYAMVGTRIDIAFATFMVSRFVKNPSLGYFNAINQILRYLAGNWEKSITFGRKKELKLVGYYDSDWAGDHADQKSTSGFVFILNGGLISYASKKQAVLSLLSTEAEYVALSLAAWEATWLRLLLIELGLLTPSKQFAEIHVSKNNKCVEEILPTSAWDQDKPIPDVWDQDKPIADAWDQDKPVPDELISKKVPITIKEDNQSSISLANNPVLHMQIKHINIQYYYIRNEVTSGRINLMYTPTREMLADGLTKPLSHIKFLNFIRQMRMEW